MTETRTLHQIWSDAVDAIDTYRSPDLTEFREAFEPITMALGRGSFKYDDIVDLEHRNNEYTVHTKYSVRNCAQTGEYRIPDEVFNATFPLEQAQVYRTRLALKKAEEELRGFNASISKAAAAVVKANQEFTQALTALDVKIANITCQ